MLDSEGIGTAELPGMGGGLSVLEDEGKGVRSSSLLWAARFTQTGCRSKGLFCGTGKRLVWENGLFPNPP